MSNFSPVATSALRGLVVAGLTAWAGGARAQWTPSGTPICATAAEQQFPAVVEDGVGGAIVAWQDTRNGDLDIYAQRVRAAGVPQWTPDGVALSTAPGDQWEPRIASDGAGGAIVTWYDFRAGGAADVYVQRVDADGAVRWVSDGVALSTATGDQVSPAIVSDGSGGAIVAWHDSRNGAADIFAQRVDANGVTQWVPDGTALCSATGDQSLAMVAGDGAGGAIVTWQDGRSSFYHIYAQRIDAAGAVQWTVNGVGVCTTPAGGQLSPVITGDGGGGAIVAWRDARSGARGTYAQRLDGSGTAQWTLDGVALSVAGTFQLFQAIVADGSGGAIVTWQDDRAVSNYDVYAQRVDASGSPAWTANGVAVCTAANDQALPQITSDGSGGAIVAWSDVRDGVLQAVYAQRLDAAGAPQWTTDGLAVSTVASDQGSQVLTTDGSGGAILAWQDWRNGSSDVYAQRLTESGSVPTPVPAPAATVPAILSGIYPNPSGGSATFDLELTRPSPVRLEVFDVAGRLLRRMTYPELAGSRRIAFDGRDDRGDDLPSGVYLCRLHLSGTEVASKLVIAR
ncbi:MAG: FlgD immunoglobulin-like domain containing protein [bacterium]